MRIYESAEDYLEAILFLTKKNGSVRSVDIANHLGFSKPSVSIAMKKLRENGYIAFDEDGLISLLPPGHKIARKTAERHRILCDLFIHLGVDVETAEKDACKIEHDLSAETFEKIKAYAEEHNLC